jgi:hypothetical protein
LMSATYDLLTQNSLTPTIPDDFPWLPGFVFKNWLNISDRLAFWNIQLWKEVSFMGLLAESPQEYLLVILGTHNGIEWAEDAEAIPRAWKTADGLSCNVETGFLAVYQETSMAGSNTPLPVWMQAQCGGQKPIRIIGHSLGASAGAIACADAFQPLFTLFAMPLWSDIAASRHVLAKARPGSLVIRNVRDLVPAAPPFPLYQSVLPEEWFNSDANGVSGDEGDRHRMPTAYLPACLP